MSSKTKKKKSEKSVAHHEAQKEPPVRPSGRIPLASIVSRHGPSMVTRPGRGFSLGEISGAGLAQGLATKWGVWVDTRRRSVLAGNVDSLKTWGSHALSKKTAEHKAERVKEPLVTIERIVETEAREVRKEIAKGEKAAKKVAAKAEKVVKKKVKKIKASSRKKRKK